MPNTPCWVDKKEGEYSCLIPVPAGSTSQTRAWEEMCHRFVKLWLRNEPENITRIVFVLSPASSRALDAAQEKRERRAQRGKTRVL